MILGPGTLLLKLKNKTTMSKKNAGKTDELKELKAPKKKSSPKSNGVVTEPLSTFQTPKTGRLTTDELSEKISRDLVVYYISIEKETDFLILTADDKNKKLPKAIEDTFRIPVHKKFKTALHKLAVHAAILSNYIDIGDIKKVSDIPAELYADFNVTSVHFKYGKKGDSIQINATCRTFRDKAHNFTTPLEYLEMDEETAYQFQDDLLKIRQNIFDRIDNYMSGEERGDVNEIGMFYKGEEEKQQYPMTSNKEVDVTDLYKN